MNTCASKHGLNVLFSFGGTTTYARSCLLSCFSISWVDQQPAGGLCAQFLVAFVNGTVYVCCPLHRHARFVQPVGGMALLLRPGQFSALLATELSLSHRFLVTWAQGGGCVLLLCMLLYMMSKRIRSMLLVVV
jgi:hypothetical protein